MKKAGIKLKALLFIAVFTAGVLFLNAKEPKKQDFKIKSDTKKIEDFSEIKLDLSQKNPLSFKDRKVLKLENQEKENSFISEVYHLPYKVNALGAYWKEDVSPGASIEIEVRLNEKGLWKDWQKVLIGDTNDGKDGSKKGEVFGELVFGEEIEAFQYKSTLKREALNVSPSLKEISFAYIDSTKSPKPDQAKKKLINEAKAAGPSIVTRAGWGCAEANYSPGWPPDYPTDNGFGYGYKKIIIHHTTGPNYQAISAIWDYHANSRGWGDIGYNYLIDPQGNIYEGRYGGENVIGGHAFKYNWGSIGISMIGTYSDSDITPQARDALTEIIAERTSHHNIDPAGSSVFLGQLVPNVGGHREYAYYDPSCSGGVCWKNSTECPGTVFFSTMNSIRNVSVQKWWNYAYPWRVEAQNSFTDRSLATPLSLNNLAAGQTATLRIVVKNLGPRTWYKGGANPVRLGTNNPEDRLSGFAYNNWISRDRPTGIVENEVPQGSNATFIFDIVAPNRSGTFREYFSPVVEGVRWMNDMNLYFYIGVTSSGTYGWQPVSQNAFTDETQTVPFDPTTAKPGDEFVLRLKAKNVGNITWTKTGASEVLLGTSNPRDRISPFATGSWVSAGRPARLTEDSVAPGGVGTYVFRVRAPGNGVYWEYFNLVASNIGWLNDPGISYYIVSNGVYGWQFISQGASKSLAGLTKDDTVTLNLTARNNGNITWQKEGPNAVHLATTNPRNRASAFCDASWIACGRPAKLTENSVVPGGTGHFSWIIKVPKNNGAYMENVSLAVEGIGWLNDPGVSYYITVNNIYGWQFLGQAAAKDIRALAPGEQALLGLTFKNTGNVNWYKNGPVILGTSQLNDRFSQFYDSSWLTPIRPARIQQDIVRPGEIGTFEWLIKAPLTPGFYMENFNLVADGVGWLNDPGVGYGITVHGQIMTMSSPGDYWIYADGNYLKNVPAENATRISYWNGTYFTSAPGFSYSSSSPVRIIPSGSPIIRIDSYSDPGTANYNLFKGVIEVRYSPVSNALWAINELPVEDYLKGMAETSDSHMEYLKTMTVVARSYAEWHISRGGKHAGEPFHLKNSRRGNGNDQVYAGYAREVLTPRLTQAVDATANQVVVYPGYAVCITPYSHGGRLWEGGPLKTRAGTEINLSLPWLLQVDDPTGDPNAWLNKPSGNHLVGLSASGASGWANSLPPVYDQNYYQQILSYYYRGTSIGTLPDPLIRVAIYRIQF